MQGTSRASLAAGEEQLDALLTSGEADSALAMGDELFAVAEMLDANPSLRRVASDPSRSPDAKSDLVRGLLAGKVSDDTIDLLCGLVRSRWSNARDLADACEHLSVVALVAAAEQEGRLDDVEDQLFRFGRLVEGSPPLRAALTDRGVDARRKDALITQLIGEKVGPEALRLVLQAVGHPRGRRMQAGLEAYGQVAAQRRDRLVATVVAAVPLTQEQQDRLSAALVHLYGRTMHLNIDVDPGVVGGLRLQVGNEVIDSTVLTRLQEARRRLAG